VGLPARLKTLRRERHLTKADLASRSGLAFRTIHDLERGRRKRVLEKTLVLLANALDVSYDELIRGSGNPDTNHTDVYRPRRRLLWAVVGLCVVVFVTWVFVAKPWNRKSPVEKYVTTSSREARRQYEAGVEALTRLHREEAVNRFERALEHDSTFVMAYIRLTNPQIRGSAEEATGHITQAEKYADQATPVERFYVRSRRAYLERDVETAIAVLESLVADFPSERSAYALKGFYHAQQGDYDRAIQSFHRSLEIFPDDGSVYNRLAYAYHAVGDVDNALWAADQYVRLAPYEANPYDTRGDLLSRNGKPDEAISSYKRAVDLKPDFYPSIQSLGVLYLLKRDYETAESYFRQLILMANAGARGRGRLYLAGLPMYCGRLDEALETLDQGIAADALDRHTNNDLCHKYQWKAAIYLTTGDHDRAVDVSEKMLETAREFARVWLPEWFDDHVYVLSRVGRKEEAAAYLDSIQAMVQDTGVANSCYYWFAKGWLDFYKQDYFAACAAFKLAYELNDVFHHGYAWGRACLKAGRAEEAAAIFDRLLSQYRADRITYPLWAVNSYYFDGVAHELLGEYEIAEALYGEFLDIRRDSHPAFRELTLDTESRLSRR
jgi:tetratricopeptide (TPR) repeat protein